MNDPAHPVQRLKTARTAKAGSRRIPESLLNRLAHAVESRLGLLFLQSRHRELERGALKACLELDEPDEVSCLLGFCDPGAAEERIKVLAKHLTIGETYFFRDPGALEALERKVLPALIRERAKGERRLRLWSAGCCTGEEPYSLAIILDRLLPGRQDWDISILATDVSKSFLDKAAQGLFREWSFRNPPPWLKSLYFTREGEDAYRIRPDIREMVRFFPFNLVGAEYPSPGAGIAELDVVLCRNVLIYFSNQAIREVLAGVGKSLRPGGWFVTSPSEGAKVMDLNWPRAVHFPGAILYRREAGPATPRWRGWESGASAGPASPARTLEGRAPAQARAFPVGPLASLAGIPSEAALATPPPVLSPAAVEAIEAALDEGQTDAAAAALAALEQNESLAPSAFARLAGLLALRLADSGRLGEAADWGRRAVAADKLNAFHQYLLGMVFQELGDMEEARLALTRALYADQDFIMAHVALAGLASAAGDFDEARRRSRRACALLEAYDADDFPPHSDGLTAGRLKELAQRLSSD